MGMIAIAGSMTLVRREDRAEVIERSAAWVRSIREDEPGCLAYAFTPDSLDPCRIVVFELWSDADALEAHFSHPNFTGMRAVLRDYQRGPSEVRKYAVAAEAPVYGPDGRPTASFEAGVPTP